MLTLNIREKNGEERQLQFDKEEVTIGRASGSDIVLPRNNISKRHARLVDKHDKVVIVDLRSTNGTYVNGRRITAPELLTPEDKVYIGDFVIRLELAGQAPPPPRRTEEFNAPAPAPRPDPRMEHAPTIAVKALPDDADDVAIKAIDAIEDAALAEIVAPAPQGPPPMPAGAIELDEEAEEATQALNLADIAAIDASPMPPSEPPTPPPSAAKATSLGHRVAAAPAPAPPQPPPSAAAPPELEPTPPPAREVAPEPAPFEGDEEELGLDAWDEWNATVAVVVEAIEGKLAPDAGWDEAQRLTEQLVDRFIADGDIAEDVERDALIQDVVTELVGLGPLEDLLSDDEIERIAIDGVDVIRVWREGVVEPYGRIFAHRASYERIIERLLDRAGIDPATASPVVEGLLPGGVSLQIVRAPVSTGHAAVLLRRASARAASLEELQAAGGLDEAMVGALTQAIAAGSNIVVTGRPGSGRTALLSALLSAAPVEERLVVIGEAHAPLAPQLDIVRLDRHTDEVDCEDIYALALRLRADRLVIDDIDATNVVEFISVALSAGSPVLATAREADADRALKRLALQLELSSGAALGDRARAMVGEAIDLLVCLDEATGAGPVVKRIVEVRGTKDGYGVRVLAKRTQSA